jgi:hypothetical protein
MPTLQGVYADLVGQEQDQDDHLQQLLLLKHLFAPTTVAEHATNVNPQQMAHTRMLKSFAPKVFP